ncbi:MAG: ABC transporter ATP-binding protein [Deltaproteobacteria bacterium]|nr:ABC transporter ATP-binding protein [Deltaproteobacteria bacterium]
MNAFLPILRRIIDEGRPRIPSFLLLSGVGLLLIPLDFYGLSLSRKLIDKGFMVQDWQVTKGILLILILVFFVRSLAGYGTALFSTRLQLRMNQDFQDRLVSHVLHLPLAFFAREPTGRLMSRILEDATLFSQSFNLLFGPALLNPLRGIALLVFLMVIHARMSLLMLISVIVSILVIQWAGNRIRILSREIQNRDAAIYSYLEQAFPNIELIKSRGTEQETARGFHRLIEEMIALSLKELRVSLISTPLLQLLKYLALGSVFLYGSWLTAENRISFGTLTLFLGTTYLFFNTLNALGNNYRSLRGSLARMEIVYGILDSPPERSTISPGNAMPAPVDLVRFSGITFGYRSSRPVLREVSFHIRRGEILGITGQSGSGKTTLTRLLLRFYEPDSGEIRVNGRPLRDIPLASLRSSIGIAFQDNLILSGTIRDNIAYGDPSLPMERVVLAARISRAHDFIKDLPDLYDTPVGEVGKVLSGGERQRIAIARALVSDPQILILDEATSFLELEQEAAVLKGIKEARRDRITLVISHRLSALGATDRILTLDNGTMIDTDFGRLAAVSYEDSGPSKEP